MRRMLRMRFHEVTRFWLRTAVLAWAVVALLILVAR